MITKKLPIAAVAIAVLIPAVASSDPVPSALFAAAAKARLKLPFVAWCSGEFRPGRPDAFAVAVRAAQGPGRYVVIERDGRSFELSSFRGRADLSCYTAAEAKRLSVAIAASETIQGNVNPLWSTSVICGFVEETSAICWQYSPAKGGFVKVGEWVT